MHSKIKSGTSIEFETKKGKVNRTKHKSFKKCRKNN